MMSRTTTAGRLQVLSAGFVCGDLVLRPVDSLPPLGGNRLVETARLAPGGCAANTAVNFARLGCRSALAGRVGEDMLGRLIRDALAREGVETDPLLITPAAATAVNTALVSTKGERSFYVFPGACDQLAGEDLPDTLLAPFQHLHLAAVGALPGLAGQAGAALARRARDIGLTVSLDVALNPLCDPVADVAPLLDVVDLFLPNLAEARAVLGEDSVSTLVERGLDRGLRLVGIKLGEQGCILATATERLHVPAFSLPVVDTTGAGDAWSAAVVYGWLQGWPLARVGRFANAAGALSTQTAGAIAGFADEAVVWRFADSAPRRPS